MSPVSNLPFIWSTAIKIMLHPFHHPMLKIFRNFWCRQNNDHIPQPNHKTLSVFPSPPPTFSVLSLKNFLPSRLSHYHNTRLSASYVCLFFQNNITPHVASSSTIHFTLTLLPSLWTSCPQEKYSKTFFQTYILMFSFFRCSLCIVPKLIIVSLLLT